MFRKIILECFLECPQRLAAVRDLRLFFCRKLCKGLSLVRHEEHGIVAEAARAVLFVQDPAAALAARHDLELVKGRVLESALMSAREVCDVLCEQTGAEGVQVVGSKFVIYRKSEKLERERKAQAQPKDMRLKKLFRAQRKPSKPGRRPQ